MYDDAHPAIRRDIEPAQSKSSGTPLRTVISVVLAPDVETNADVITCTAEAIQALPYVTNVTTRKVRARVPRVDPDYIG